MTAYYNEIDPFAAQWLRELIKAGHIAPGDVDERSIVDVRPDDLKSYTQCHFFAGIGGWSYALRLAGWPDNRPVWTGSCPCQPFSTASAGKGGGFSSEKHLWPEWFRLISALRPDDIFGEQVAVSDAWTDKVWSDVESIGFTFWTAELPAGAVGADHRRPRRWLVAHSDVRAEHGCPEYAETQMLPRRDRIGTRILPTDGVSLGMAERSARKAFGNAIVPQIAAEIISAYIDHFRGVRLTGAFA